MRRNLLAVVITSIGLVVHVGAGPGGAASTSLKIKKTTFARQVSDSFEVKGPTTKFRPNETVNLLVELKGRPKKGILAARWTFRGNEIGKAKVDASTVNKGLLFSVGQNTYAKFNFTPGPEGLPLGNSYRVELTTDGIAAGSYPFEVISPTGAIPSKLSKITTSRGENGPAATTFARTDTVHVTFTGDLGTATWVEAQWTVGGKVDPKGTRSVTMQGNQTAAPGYFSFVPDGGWPVGKHSVTLYMNDRTIGTYPFTVS